jgi:MerR family copper efflux transcriptional regulator
VTTFTIGQVAERSGFSASALRYYEEIGLIAPATRTEAGYRLYDDHALSRLAFVARAKQLGCSLEEINDLLGVWDGEQCGPVQRRFHDLVTDKMRSTQGQIAQLIAFASQLQAAAARLDVPPIDGPCDNDCACMADDAARTSTPVMLSVSTASAPIACTLNADAIPERIDQWQSLLTKVRARVTTPDGRLRIEFGDGVDLGELARVVAAEQQCCRFFDFAMTIDRRGIALEVDAPDEAAEITSAVFGTAS